MLFSNLLIPLTMIGCGACFRKKAPGQINVLFGYGICIIQLVVMLVPIFLTESALKKRFDGEE